MGKCKLYITSKGQMQECAVKEGVVWETRRKGTPGKLTFTVMNDDVLSFTEGDQVRFDYDGHKIFFGYVFTKKRSDNRMIQVTAYDQLRYFKNKDTYNYENKTAAALLKTVVEDFKDFKLEWGIVEDTKYVIPYRLEDDQELFTIMNNAISDTIINTGRMFVLYDDFGKLNLQEASSLRTDILIDEESGETFEYTSSIDESTYNKIKLVRENKEKGIREVFVIQHGENVNQWGVLQFTGKVEEGENGKAKVNALLALYNRKSRKLHINKVFGDTRVRGGSTIGVQMNLGDLIVANFMMVEAVKHTFRESDHRMDLNLIGGDFIA